MTTQAKMSSTTIALETQHSANGATTMSIESPRTHTPNSIPAILDSNLGRRTFTVYHYNAQETYEISDGLPNDQPQTSHDGLDATTLKTRLDDLVEAVAKEHLFRLCPNLPWDPNRGKTLETNTSFPSPSPSLSASPKNNVATTTPITADHSTRQRSCNNPKATAQNNPTNGPVIPKSLKDYPPYIFIPDTQRRAAEPAYFEGRIP